MVQIEDYSQTAERIQRTASFFVKASIEKTFPLFGPIREMDWEAGWKPKVIYALHPEVEEHMIFKSPARYEGEEDYTWIVTQLRPKEYFIEYTVSTSERIWFISVECKPEDKQTSVRVTYKFTGLTERGIERNRIALEKIYARDLKDWEEAVNFYVSTGKCLE